MFKTREKSYTNCHPEIAKALRDNKEILCWVWDSDERYKSQEYVIDYRLSSLYLYCTLEDVYINAIPVYTKLRVKKASEVIKILEERGYTFRTHFAHKGPEDLIFTYDRLKDCGKEYTEEDSKYYWADCFLEEVEE